jgi:hypothetical protein
MAAATALESMPPLRNTPSGTSLSSSSRTASRNVDHSRSASSPSDARASSGSGDRSSCQYARSVRQPFSTISACPGCTRRTRSKMLYGVGTYS